MYALIFSAVLTFMSGSAVPVAPAAPAAMPANAYVMDPDDPFAAELCASRGGTLPATASGEGVCTLPKDCKPWSGPSLMETTILAPDTEKTRAACFARCGQVSSNPSGQRFCSVPAHGSDGSRSWAPREPTNMPREPTN
ncbi:MAG TPA: hypothetical protein DCL48_14655 [Alphaproteobacteria bacterium]|nr:hypothetical protein [Alphaproteobacteria bacterium]